MEIQHLPSYTNLEHRISTFVNSQYEHRAEELSTNGFFFNRKTNGIICYDCNIELFDISPSDIISIEHVMHSPACDFATKKIHDGLFIPVFIKILQKTNNIEKQLEGIFPGYEVLEKFQYHLDITKQQNQLVVNRFHKLNSCLSLALKENISLHQEISNLKTWINNSTKSENGEKNAMAESQ